MRSRVAGTLLIGVVLCCLAGAAGGAPLSADETPDLERVLVADSNETDTRAGRDADLAGPIPVDEPGAYERDLFTAPGDSLPSTPELSDHGDSAGRQTTVSGEANLTIASLAYPDTVGVDADFAVEYTLENDGSVEGTESFVNLNIDGPGIVDFDEDVTVPPGETASGTLVFSSVAEEFTPGDTIGFEVELFDFGDLRSGTVDVVEDADPALELSGVAAPGTVPLDGTLPVNYTVANVGNGTGIESAVELLVNGTVEDSDTDVIVGAGETASGTLVFDGVGGYNPGDSIGWTVALSEFGDSAGGQTAVSGEANLTVGSLSYPDTVDVDTDLAVEYTLENAGSAEGTESSVDLSVDGVGVVDSEKDVTVAPGGTANGTLLFTGVGDEFVPGDTVPFTVALADFGDSATGSTGVDEADSPEFAVGIAGTNSPVVAGETLSVTATVENVGEVAGTQTVTLDAGALGSSLRGVSLNSGESTVLALSVATGSGDTGTYTMTVESANDSSSTSVTVLAAANFAVGFDATNGPVVAGETLSVTATVENVGEVAGTQSVNLSTGGLGSNSTALTLGPGNLEQVVLTVDTEEGDAGEYTAQVTTANDSDSQTVTVEEADSPEFAVDIVGTNDPVDEGETLEVAVAVENVGTASGTQSVDLSTGGLGSNSTALTLGPGNLEQVVLTVDTEEGDAGEYTAQVTTANSSDSQTVTVEEDTGVPEFAVDIEETNAPVVEGKTLKVTVAVENVGDAAGVQTVTAQAPALGEISEAFNLTPGAVAERTLSIQTEIGDTGEYSVTIQSTDDTAQESVSVQLPVLPKQNAPPTDLTGDGRYEDVDGDGRLTIFDVQTFFNYFDDPAVQSHAWAYDFTGEGEVSIFDVQELFNRLGE